MMSRNMEANRMSFGFGLLILLISAGASLAQYNSANSAGAQYNQAGSYRQPYVKPFLSAFQTRDLLQSDVKNCTDIHCNQEECCVETPRSAICVELTIVNITTGDRRCVRPKLCMDDSDCYLDGCCVYNSYVTSDTTGPGYPDYGKYPPQSFPGQVVVPRVGICLQKPNVDDALCHLSITDNLLCPCGVTADGMTLTCLPDFAGSSTGTCQLPDEVTA